MDLKHLSGFTMKAYLEGTNGVSYDRLFHGDFMSPPPYLFSRTLSNRCTIIPPGICGAKLTNRFLCFTRQFPTILQIFTVSRAHLAMGMSFPAIIVPAWLGNPDVMASLSALNIGCDVPYVLLPFAFK